MASSGFSATFLTLALLAGGLASPASAQQAASRCEGTLCDLYYGAQPAPQAAPPASATTMTDSSGGFLNNIFGGGGSQPATSAPAQAAPRAPLMQVEGGGLLGVARGAPSERCGGTLCDLFYGGPSPEEQREANQVNSEGAGQPARTVLAPGAAPQPEDEPRPVRRRNASRDHEGVDYAREQPERPQCVAPPGDPWRCYRK